MASEFFRTQHREEQIGEQEEGDASNDQVLHGNSYGLPQGWAQGTAVKKRATRIATDVTSFIAGLPACGCRRIPPMDSVRFTP